MIPSQTNVKLKFNQTIVVKRHFDNYMGYLGPMFHIEPNCNAFPDQFTLKKTHTQIYISTLKFGLSNKTLFL